MSYNNNAKARMDQLQYRNITYNGNPSMKYNGLLFSSGYLSRLAKICKASGMAELAKRLCISLWSVIYKSPGDERTPGLCSSMKRINFFCNFVGSRLLYWLNSLQNVTQLKQDNRHPEPAGRDTTWVRGRDES